MKRTKILFVQPIGQFSGSLKSLEEYVKILPKQKYEFFFLTQKGIAVSRLKKYGKVISSIGIAKFDNTQLGYYRGFRWILLLRELIYLITSFFSVYKVSKEFRKIDLIHINEITAIPIIYLLKIFYKIPIIIHARSIFNNSNFFSKYIKKILKKNVKKIIAIDNDVKASLPKSLKVVIIRNILVDKIKSYKKTKNNQDYLNIGYVGTYLKYKGVEDLIYSFKYLLKKKYKIKLYLAGDVIRNKNFIIKYILNIFSLNNDINIKTTYKIKNLYNLGLLNNLSIFYKKIDVLCFPSYLNALGRQVFEAGLYGLPSIVCLKKNVSDSFINNKTGISYKHSGSNKDLQKAIIYFYNNRNKIKTMGLNAKKLINKNYSTEKNLKKLQKVYELALE